MFETCFEARHVIIKLILYFKGHNLNLSPCY